MNSSDVVYDRGLFLLSFMDSECSCETETTAEDYDDAIEEYQFLLDDAILKNNSKEIADLRRDIQKCKVEKRRFKRMINKMTSEVAYS